MSHVLDRPAWNALTSHHASLAEGSPQAWRYPFSIVPFAAAADGSQQSLAALGALPAGDEVMVLVEPEPPAVPSPLQIVAEDVLVQMLAKTPFENLQDSRITPLGEADAADMLELANLTRPGPFTLRAQALGPFWGIRENGRLVAMGGQRMRVPGFSELSGLCVHPDMQGKGFGKLMLRFVAGEICARGEQVFLHVRKGNTGAIALYEALGFSALQEMQMRVVKKI